MARSRRSKKRRCATAYDATMRQRNANASGLKPTVRIAVMNRELRSPQLEQLERREHRREPERVRVEAGEHRRGREHAEDARRPERRASPFPHRDRREEDRRRDSRDEDEREIPDDHRREVVEEAVRGERVPARVREVVPDEDPVPDEPRPVQVHAGIARPRAGHDDERPDDRRDRGSDEELATAHEARKLNGGGGCCAHLPPPLSHYRAARLLGARHPHRSWSFRS